MSARERASGGWRERVSAAARVLLVIGVLGTAIAGVWEAPQQISPRSRYAPPDVVMKNERRFEPLRALLVDKRITGVLGYLLVTTALRDQEAVRTEAYFSAQFAVVPWTLSHSLAERPEWVVVDFVGTTALTEHWAPPAGYVVERGFGGGVSLLRRTEG